MNVHAKPLGEALIDGLLTTRERDGVVTLTLNRPAQYNALSEDLLAALQAAFDRLAGDETVRCVVIAGAGKAFCAGHDLREMRGHDDESYFRDLFVRCGRVMQAIRALPVPVIAQVHGVATAAGCQLAAACDLAMAGRSARFAVSGINVGLFCSTPAVTLSRNVPTKAAFDMLVTGRFIDAEEAYRLGLVNKVVDDDELNGTVQTYAAEICAKSAEAVRVGKRMFYAQAEMNLADAYRYAGETMACNIMHEDARRGIDAFLTRRK
jgi:enoyl-CoA hydratase/carnithine racemase